MPATKRITPAQIRKMVARVARELARERGWTLSHAALTELLRPSTRFFADQSPAPIDERQLRKELAPIVEQAIGFVRGDEDASKDAKAYRIRVNGRIQKLRRNPRPPKRAVRKDDIREAMKRATCHFLWFC